MNGPTFFTLLRKNLWVAALHRERHCYAFVIVSVGSSPGAHKCHKLYHSLVLLLHCKAMPYLFYFLVVRKGIVSLYNTLNISSREARMCWITHQFFFHPAALLSKCFAKMLRTHKFNGSVAGLQELINNFKREPNVWLFNCIKRHNQVLLPYLYSLSLSSVTFGAILAPQRVSPPVKKAFFSPRI